MSITGGGDSMVSRYDANGDLRQSTLENLHVCHFCYGRKIMRHDDGIRQCFHCGHIHNCRNWGKHKCIVKNKLLDYKKIKHMFDIGGISVC